VGGTAEDALHRLRKQLEDSLADVSLCEREKRAH